MVVCTQRRFHYNCSCGNTFYPSQEIQWDKYNLTHFSTNCRFEDLSWIVPRATENAVVGHMWPTGR